MTEPILQCRDLKKQYPLQAGSLKVLKGVSFTLHSQEMLAIVGVSGSGKTTLLNLLYGIDQPSSGEITFNGHLLSTFSREEFRQFRQDNMGMIFQDFYLLPSMTAIENVMAPIILAGKSEQLAMIKAYRLLEQVDMRKMANKLPGQLSNGQKQRVAIARAIANDPRILICDEPTRALDTALGDEIMDLIGELIQMNHLSVILTTHDPEVATRADKILIIRDGKLVEEKIKEKKTFDFKQAKYIYQSPAQTEDSVFNDSLE